MAMSIFLLPLALQLRHANFISSNVYYLQRVPGFFNFFKGFSTDNFLCSSFFFFIIPNGLLEYEVKPVEDINLDNMLHSCGDFLFQLSMGNVFSLFLIFYSIVLIFKFLFNFFNEA